jgi:hypothetical protein
MASHATLAETDLSSAWTIRISGLPSRTTLEELKALFAEHGPALHIHHMRHGSEAIIILKSKATAEAATEALAGGALQQLPSIQRTLEQREKARKRAEETGQGIAFCHIGGPRSSPLILRDDDPNYRYGDNMTRFLNAWEGLMGGAALEAVKSEWEGMAKAGATQSGVARLLLKVRDNIPDETIKDEEALAVWTETMRLFAAGKLQQHGDRFADTINELLGCLDTSQGDLENAFAETE